MFACFLCVAFDSASSPYHLKPFLIGCLSPVVQTRQLSWMNILTRRSLQLDRKETRMVSEGGGADEETRAMEAWLPHRCLAIGIRKKEEGPLPPRSLLWVTLGLGAEGQC